jgi:hypothetical protein
VVHVSKQVMALYADYMVHEYGEVSHDYVFVNWWGGRLGVPMRYATAIDLFRKLCKKTLRKSAVAIHARHDIDRAVIRPDVGVAKPKSLSDTHPAFVRQT